MLHTRRLVVALAVFVLCFSAALAQQRPAAPHPMTFFVTSEPMGDGGNLGGLAGADGHCQQRAAAVGAGDRTWHAYLSTQSRPGKPAVNARDRIGTGPWYNVRGEMIARDLAHLHGDTLDLARLGNNLNKQTGLTEKGQIVPGLNDFPDPRDNDWDYVKTTPYSNRHEMLTGTQPDGRAFPPDVDYTCDNWTSNTDPDPSLAAGPLAAAPGKPNAQIGFPDRNGGGNGSWNSSHGTRGCSQRSLVRTHGIGMFYCFAID
ncbi:MAG: lectin [Acidobacteria bacterium]|nr:lectin [Acidobacteriota bacterium]